MHSHIIPGFVIRWLKRTSATGYLRSLETGERLQEGMREYLLCAVCEQILGRYEKQFAERIFLPYQNRPQPQVFAYEEWLLRFVSYMIGALNHSFNYGSRRRAF
jgi:hypothetical protein